MSSAGHFDPTGTYLDPEGSDGRVDRIPTRPDGEYLLALKRDTSRRDAARPPARPAEELLDEITSWTQVLHDLDQSFSRGRRS